MGSRYVPLIIEIKFSVGPLNGHGSPKPIVVAWKLVRVGECFKFPVDKVFRFPHPERTVVGEKFHVLVG